jgi:hypothetical protein
MSCVAGAGIGCVVGGASAAGMQYAYAPGNHTPGGYALNIASGGLLARMGGATQVDNWKAGARGLLQGAGIGDLVGWGIQQAQGFFGW